MVDKRTHSTKFQVRGWQMELVRSDQVEAAANTLAEAFWDDPLMQIVAPNEKKRTSSHPGSLPSRSLMACVGARSRPTMTPPQSLSGFRRVTLISLWDACCASAWVRSRLRSEER